MADETPDELAEAEVSEDTQPTPPSAPIDIAAIFAENTNLKETLAVVLMNYGTDGRLELPSEFELPALFALGGSPDEKTGKFVLWITTDPAELERIALGG